MRWILVLLLLAPALLAQTSAIVYGNGDQPPANNVAQGQTDFVALGFVVLQTFGTSSITFTSCTIANIATPNPAGPGDAVRIRLIRDDDMNLQVSAGDTVLATVNNPSFPLTFSGFNSPVPSATSTTFSIIMVAIDVENSATINDVYRLQLTSYLTTANINDGAPITGENQTIVAPSNAEMDVRRLGQSIAPGGEDDVGGLQVNVANSLTWTIHNTGADPLQLTGSPRVYFPISSVSQVNCNAVVSVQPASPVAALTGTTTFTISVTPTLLGQPFGFAMAINNNDAQDNPYVIIVTGFATVGPGPATQLAVTTQPGSGEAGAALTAQPAVQARDSSGALDTSFTGTVTANLGPVAGSPPPALIGTVSVNAIGGIATFTNIGVDTPGVDYTLVFTSGTLAAGVSAPFTVTAAPATHLVVGIQPGNGVAGAQLSVQPVVEARGSGGLIDTGFNGTVTAVLSGGTPGAVLFGTVAVNAVAGIATFTDLAVDLAGTGYELDFTSGALTSATSATFDVASTAPTQLAVSTQPGNGEGGAALSAQPVIEARDAGGQLAGSFVGDVSVSLSGGTAGATLLGTLTVQAVAGIAAFTDLAVDLAGSGYTLTFTGGGLAQAVSAPFDVAVGPGAALIMLTQPGSATPSQPLSPQPSVAIVDLGGNTVVSDNSSNISVMIASGPAGALLTGTVVATASAGIVTWADIGIDTAGTFTLEFFDGALTPVVSQPLGIVASGAPPTGGSGGSSGSGCAVGGSASMALLPMLLLVLSRRRRRACD